MTHPVRKLLLNTMYGRKVEPIVTEPYTGGHLELFKADPDCANCKGTGIEPGSGTTHGVPPYAIDPASYEPCFCVFTDRYVDEVSAYPTEATE